MPFTDEQIVYVYHKTRGYCYYCKKKLSLSNYGKNGSRGSWHIDHSKPKSRGGTDYLRNLVPACIKCNIDKSTTHGRYFKSKFEHETFGGQLVDALGLPEGFLGASRRKKPKF